MAWPKGQKRGLAQAMEPVFDEVEIVPARDGKIPEVRRFEMADIGTHAPWMVERLKRWYPQINEANIVGWLRTLIGSNEFLFLRGENSVGLAQLYNELMDPNLYVREVWTAMRGDDEGELVAILMEYRRWGQLHGAVRMTFSEKSDIDTAMVKAAFGSVKERVVEVSELGRASLRDSD